MIDRGIIKWQPFESVYSTGKMIREIEQKKDRLVCPTLSDDQLMIIEENIKRSYLLKENIRIKYFYDGIIFDAEGIVRGIDKKDKKIIMDSKIIYFEQIIAIN